MGGKQSMHKEINTISKQFSVAKRDLKVLFQNLVQRFPYGSVPRDQLSKIMNLSNPTTQMVDSLYFLFDINDDGIVSIPEYVVVMLLYERASPLEKILFAFDVYDTDRTGKITHDEVERMIAQLYKSFPKEFKESGKTPAEFAHDFFSELDVDKDGSITREEFAKVALNHNLISMALQNTLNTTM
ncbi:hypothetical protein C9374_000608 [Naegleria lovaniensis]|uniref:EF-hand domain-containing protein n=1 Tax=Naegleria lovaniensis TaxID=51637 RepID=A0AA88GZC4_NAELO|nr:uncharacterized protein C9374_000608 [Naegleria lovaniensis]KAG2388444.1 hypothetical protein C9374_000608 [Naegleria lovaniensis]